MAKKKVYVPSDDGFNHEKFTRDITTMTERLGKLYEHLKLLSDDEQLELVVRLSPIMATLARTCASVHTVFRETFESPLPPEQLN